MQLLRKFVTKKKDKKLLLKQERINKLRKLKGKPPIDFGPNFYISCELPIEKW